jgi:hypothetical protein
VRSHKNRKKERRNPIGVTSKTDAFLQRGFQDDTNSDC